MVYIKKHQQDGDVINSYTSLLSYDTRAYSDNIFPQLYEKIL